ncbi:MAG: hypothetical protein ABUK01_13365 [Leptospirales bacterium]
MDNTKNLINYPGEWRRVNYKRELEAEPLAKAIDHLIDTQVDLSLYEMFFGLNPEKKKEYSIQAMLKVIIYSYAKGIVRPAEISLLCIQNMLFVSLARGTQVSASEIAEFSGNFTIELKITLNDVLLICWDLGLLGNVAKNKPKYRNESAKKQIEKVLKVKAPKSKILEFPTGKVLKEKK